MKTYEITDIAGDYVAGRRVAGIDPSPDGKRRVRVTPEAAEYDLITGALAEDAPAEPVRIARPATGKADPTEG